MCLQDGSISSFLSGKVSYVLKWDLHVYNYAMISHPWPNVQSKLSKSPLKVTDE